jgi:general secretion pathway protein G
MLSKTVIVRMNNMPLRVGGAIVLAIAILSGCGKRETDAERQGDAGDKGREAIHLAMSQLGLFETALGRYQQSVGDFPTTKQGLQALRTRPPDLPKGKQWNGPYLNPEVSLQPLNLELPLDPWGHPYHYRSPGIHNPDTFDVWSVGPGGVDGSADDIGNWK